MCKRLLAPLMVCAGVCALCGLAHAGGLNTLQVYVVPDYSDGTSQFARSLTQEGPIDISGSATGASNSYGNAAAHGDYGVVTLSGSAHGALDTSCATFFRDEVTITAPGVPTNTLGHLTFSVRVDGALSATAGNSQAQWTLQADIGGGYGISRTGAVTAVGGAFGDSVGTFSGSGIFFFGQPFQLEGTFRTQASANFDAGGAGQCSFEAMTMNWEGIQSITVNGVPVAGFSVASESGTQWEHAQPFARCGSADFNCDGDPGTDDDIQSFFRCLAGDCPQSCRNTADFDGDGDQGTDADIEAFFRVLAGGNC